ncbi:DUF559 domain-containing protein [Nonomuraea sp. NPDC046570]|uniref:endonuclease domain-containing protein n=1 Tax=Nonomuraea sp. NPDC046570 TaxID=3155255 RepID=UPI003410CD46
MVRSWAGLPVGRVVRLDGADADSIALAIDPLPEDAPAIVTYVAQGTRSASDLVTSVLDALERAAVALYPAWLPEAEGISGGAGAGVPAVRALALRRASASDHFGPFLAALATLALTGARRRDRFAPEVRAAGLARVLASGFGRTRTSLLVRVPDGLPPTAQEVLVAGCEWLADRGSLGVWLTGAPLTAVDRVPTITIHLPAATPSGDGTSGTVDHPGAVGYPAVAGRPHPGSLSERRLEAALERCAWAVGRAWNQVYSPHPLAAPIRLDLLWQEERCVVEIDGDDHRARTKFDEDRQRDVQLQIAGYAVLRFTHTHVMTDTETVVRHIEQLLRSRRGEPSEG